MNLLNDRPVLAKRFLMKAAKINPAAIKRLANYLRLRTVGYSAKQTAKLINWLLNRRLDFRK